ncbi:hypothetical protein NC653_012725 [Populus alba x Populus x berolinensis]|uniref:Uncharacterized protein n=1 Tax=Populus alba x Populus x berolinensis TaxID=444605 RepID=A0AAD6QT23_9ROSI|nr:hypothetical protein NC653_012725 [Populus alba x Populus x berolinensis]
MSGIEVPVFFTVDSSICSSKSVSFKRSCSFMSSMVVVLSPRSHLNQRRHLHFSWCRSSMPETWPIPRKVTGRLKTPVRNSTPIQSSLELVIMA